MTYREPDSFVEWVYSATSKALERVLPENVARWANDRVLLRMFGISKKNIETFEIKVDDKLLSRDARAREATRRLAQKEIEDEYGPEAMARKALEKYGK